MSIWLSWPKKCNGAIDDTVGIIYDASASTNVVTWPKSHFRSQFDCFDVRNVMVPLMTPLAPCYTKAKKSLNLILNISVTWCWYWFQWCHMTKEVMLHLILIILTQEMMWCDWWCDQFYVMLMPTPLPSHDQWSHVVPHFDCLDLGNEWCHWQCHFASGDTGASGITWPKYHIAPHFNCLDLAKTMVPFMMQSASCDQWHNMTKKVMLHLISINCLGLRNAIVPLMMLFALCYSGANGVTWPKETGCISFQLPLPKKNSDAIMILLSSYDTDTDPNGIM